MIFDDNYGQVYLQDGGVYVLYSSYWLLNITADMTYAQKVDRVLANDELYWNGSIDIIFE